MQSLISVSAAANLLGVSKSKVYCLAIEKRIPHIRIDGRILFRPETLEMWLQEQEIPARDRAS